MTKRYDVLGAGIAAVDDLLYIEEYPPVNCKIPVARSVRRGGGPACTAIAAVGALGGSTAYIARLGGNDLSNYIKASLERRGVDISHIISDPAGGPYHSIITVDKAGQRNVFYDPSLYRLVTRKDLPASLVQSAAVFLIDHLSEPGLVGTAEHVRGLGIPLLGDIEGCSETARQLAAITDYLIVPREFAAWESGETAAADACAHLARVPRLATVVTCGSEGCYFSIGRSGPVKHFPAFNVTALNTNGCGDTFHGAFAMAVARGLEVEDAIAFSSAAAAIKAMTPENQGTGWDALPTLDTVLAFLRDQFDLPHKSALLEKLDRLKLPRQ
jgi:sugar/nucleoside kinase (ribokinase family)